MNGHNLTSYPNGEETPSCYSSAGTFLLSPDGTNVLLGAHQTRFGQLWGNFAGGIENSETSAECARRELHEELGLLLEPTEFKNPITLQLHEKLVAIYYVFAPRYFNASLFIPNNEIVAINWFTILDGVSRLMDIGEGALSYVDLWGGKYTFTGLRLLQMYKHETLANKHLLTILDISDMSSEFSELWRVGR